MVMFKKVLCCVAAILEAVAVLQQESVPIALDILEKALSAIKQLPRVEEDDG